MSDSGSDDDFDFAARSIDPRTGGYFVYGRPWLPTESWTPERLVAQALAVIAARA